MAFVNDSLNALVSSLNSTVLYSRPVGSVVYSKFNFKILLFLAARGYISFIKIFSSGSGNLIKFKIKKNETGLPVFHKVLCPLVLRGGFQTKHVKFCSYKKLLSLFSSEFVIVSTNRGLMTSMEAARLCIGGFVVLVIK